MGGGGGGMEGKGKGRYGKNIAFTCIPGHAKVK